MAHQSHTGKAGHFAVMSEYAWRGYNVAMPEVDIGDDIFVINDTTGAAWRVQVKTSDAKQQKASNSFQFRLRESAITTPISPPQLHFVFALRVGAGWRYVVMSRDVLHNYTKKGVGSLGNDHRQITMTLDNSGKVLTCSGEDFSHHLEDWAIWPELSV